MEVLTPDPYLTMSSPLRFSANTTNEASPEDSTMVSYPIIVLKSSTSRSYALK